MKTLLTTILVLTIKIFAYANHNHSQLNIKLKDHSSMVIELGNAAFNSPDISFSIANVIPGSHLLKIWKVKNHPHHRPFVKKLIYSGWINIPAASIVNVIGSNNGNIHVINNPLIVSNCDNGYYSGNGADSYGNNYYQNFISNNTGYNGNGYYDAGNYVNYGSGYQLMSETKFNELKQSIVNVSFSNSKKHIAKQAVSMNKLSSKQISELVNLFDFESDKLEFAKYAYNFTIDKGNYFIVNNAFDFESSIASLNKYIGSF